MLNWFINIFSDNQSQSKLAQSNTNTFVDESIPEFLNEDFDNDPAEVDFDSESDDLDSDMLDEDEDILF